MSKSCAVIFAGGIGIRMNTKAVPKQFLLLHEKPIIIHTIEKFENCKSIDGIILVMVKEWITYTIELLKKYNIKKVRSIIAGGASGQESIYNGLVEASKIYNSDDIVLIHDGVRPLIDNDLILRCIECVKLYGTAISSAKVVETVFLSDDNKLGEVIDRNKSYIAKAPQSFYLKDILECHQKAIKDKKFNFIDSCSIMQYYGHKLSIVECNRDNIKITTPEDFYIFRAIYEKSENDQLL